mmetsp:Transcript_21009/g.41204  ORF Transcript_21009/g.41204 Transcript_21009/m.41204 type:complete len:254 (+) Transcript_21009:343-1104(+)
MKNGLLRRVTVALVRKEDKLGDGAMALECIIEAFRLNWKGTWVLIFNSVNQKQLARSFGNFRSMREWGELSVGIWCLPISALLSLKSKGCQGAVVSSRSSNTCTEKVSVSKQMCCHKATIGMPTHGKATWLTNLTIKEKAYRGLSIGPQLLNESIVGFYIGIFCNNRARKTKNNPIFDDPGDWARPRCARKKIRRGFYLTCCLGRFKLARVGPQEAWTRTIALRVIVRRQVQVCGQVNTVIALVFNKLLLNSN